MNDTRNVDVDDDRPIPALWKVPVRIHDDFHIFEPRPDGIAGTDWDRSQRWSALYFNTLHLTFRPTGGVEVDGIEARNRSLLADQLRALAEVIHRHPEIADDLAQGRRVFHEGQVPNPAWERRDWS